jgi:hypothetical protein
VIERHKGPASDWFDRKDALLDGGMSNITVRDVYVAAIKATLQFAVDQGRLSENPAAGVKVRVRKAAEERDKRFDGKEAETILSATLRKPSDRISVEMAAARRWVPWTCAYTGARRQRDHAADRPRPRPARRHLDDAYPRGEQQDAQVPRTSRSASSAVRRMQFFALAEEAHVVEQMTALPRLHVRVGSGLIAALAGRGLIFCGAACAVVFY